jgi:hypothetical protein
MAVTALPAAPSLPVVASLRETTTLITLDGTLLHRDQITLRPGAIGTALDLILPPSATLWSAKVDEVAVRPLERGNGTISVPLGFDTGKDTVVEVISVQEKVIPKGRSELALDLPQVAVPVQEHRWRLLLPEGAKYRYRSGELRPAPGLSERNPWTILASTPVVLTDRINVGGNESGQQKQYVWATVAVRGRVNDPQGYPLPGVTMTLRPDGAAPVVRVSDARGAFHFEGLPSVGGYQLQAELEGFSTVTIPFHSGPGETQTIEVRLSPAVEDVITVTAEAPMLDERRAGKTETYKMDEGSGGGRKKRAPASPRQSLVDVDAFQDLKKGLVGGVKPLPVAIPETGKLLLLSGVLPPRKIGVELEVKADKGRRGWF